MATRFALVLALLVSGSSLPSFAGQSGFPKTSYLKVRLVRSKPAFSKYRWFPSQPTAPQPAAPPSPGTPLPPEGADPQPPATPPASGYLNVKDPEFGAQGDGSTDDSLAIQKTAAAALTRHKGVFFPPGVYLHNKVLKFDGVMVLGAGQSVSVIKATDFRQTAVKLTGVSSSLSNLAISSAGLRQPYTMDEVRRGLLWTNEKSDSSATVTVANASAFKIDKCVVEHGNWRIGVTLRKSTKGSITNCLLNSVAEKQSYTDRGIAVFDCANLLIDSNVLSGQPTGLQLIGSKSTPPYYFTGNSSITISNNTLGSQTSPLIAYGIVEAGTDGLTVKNNNVNSAVPMYFDFAKNATIQTNVVAGGDYGIVFNRAVAGNNSISENRITKCNGLPIFMTPSDVNYEYRTNISVKANQIGSCMFTTFSNPNFHTVILINGSSVTRQDGITIEDNIYGGEKNNLNCFIRTRIPIGLVKGNKQTKTMLPIELK